MKPVPATQRNTPYGLRKLIAWESLEDRRLLAATALPSPDLILLELPAEVIPFQPHSRAVNPQHEMADAVRASLQHQRVAPLDPAEASSKQEENFWHRRKNRVSDQPLPNNEVKIHPLPVERATSARNVKLRENGETIRPLTQNRAFLAKSGTNVAQLFRSPRFYHSAPRILNLSQPFLNVLDMIPDREQTDSSHQTHLEMEIFSSVHRTLQFSVIPVSESLNKESLNKESVNENRPISIIMSPDSFSESIERFMESATFTDATAVWAVDSLTLLTTPSLIPSHSVAPIRLEEVRRADSIPSSGPLFQDCTDSLWNAWLNEPWSRSMIALIDFSTESLGRSSFAPQTPEATEDPDEVDRVKDLAEQIFSDASQTPAIATDWEMDEAIEGMIVMDADADRVMESARRLPAEDTALANIELEIEATMGHAMALELIGPFPNNHSETPSHEKTPAEDSDQPSPTQALTALEAAAATVSTFMFTRYKSGVPSRLPRNIEQKHFAKRARGSKNRCQ